MDREDPDSEEELDSEERIIITAMIIFLASWIGFLSGYHFA